MTLVAKVNMTMSRRTQMKMLGCNLSMFNVHYLAQYIEGM